jgi:hypothetical protein
VLRGVIQPSGKFEVTDHYELRERGAFVVGLICEGIIKPGDFAALLDGVTYWKISGVEFLDNTAERTYRNALMFRKRPARADVEREFPVGSHIDVYDADTIV